MGVMGDRLRDARERKGYTQDDLADLLGRHRASISNWERGTPPRNTLGKLRKVLDLDEQLRPLDAPKVTRPRDMSVPDLIAEFNAVVNRLNELTAEMTRRLTTGDNAAKPDVLPRKLTRTPARKRPQHAH